MNLEKVHRKSYKNVRKICVGILKELKEITEKFTENKMYTNFYFTSTPLSWL